jgi:hypothetical protein
VNEFQRDVLDGIDERFWLRERDSPIGGIGRTARIVMIVGQEISRLPRGKVKVESEPGLGRGLYYHSMVFPWSLWLVERGAVIVVRSPGSAGARTIKCVVLLSVLECDSTTRLRVLVDHRSRRLILRCILLNGTTFSITLRESADAVADYLS